MSLLRYGLALVGSGTCDQGLCTLEVCVVHELARRVAGVSRSARLPVLHAATGSLSAQNFYVQHCAAAVDLSERCQQFDSREHFQVANEEQK